MSSAWLTPAERATVSRKYAAPLRTSRALLDHAALADEIIEELAAAFDIVSVALGEADGYGHVGHENRKAIHAIRKRVDALRSEAK